MGKIKAADAVRADKKASGRRAGNRMFIGACDGGHIKEVLAVLIWGCDERFDSRQSPWYKENEHSF
jgi:hypothetical protein